MTATLLDEAMLDDAVAVFEGLFDKVEAIDGHRDDVMIMTHYGRKAEGEGMIGAKSPQEAVAGWISHAARTVKSGGTLTWRMRPEIAEECGDWFVYSRFAVSS